MRGPWSWAKNAGSEPGPTANKLGAFLIQTQLQSSAHSSAMCMTAAAQNLLSLKLAASLGIVIASPWLTWFKAGTRAALSVSYPFLSSLDSAIFLCRAADAVTARTRVFSPTCDECLMYGLNDCLNEGLMSDALNEGLMYGQ